MRSAAALLSLSACASGPGPRPRHPLATDTGAPTPRAPENVLLVIADDLGIDKVRSYHPELDDLPREPTLDALAAEGVRFETVYGSPICSPARAQLFTGRYAHQTGLGRNMDWDGIPELPLGELTLPEALAADPKYTWTSALFGKWHLADMDGPTGVDHALLSGFGEFAGTVSNLAPGYYTYQEVRDGALGLSTTYATTRVVDDALEFVGRAPEPWLLVVALHAPHGPVHRPPDELLAEPLDRLTTKITRHHAMIEAMDAELGRLLDGVGPERRARTHLIFVGDNGTSDYATSPPFDPARGKNTVFEGGVRIPLIVAGPAVPAPGVATEALVHVVDVFPTVLDLVGVALPDGGGSLGGRSLVGLLADPTDAGPRSALYTGRFYGDGPDTWRSFLWTIRDREYKIGAFSAEADDPPIMGLFSLADARYDEGEALIEPFDAEQQAAVDRLLAERDALFAETPYEPMDP